MAVDERQDPRARLRALGQEAVGVAPDAEEGFLHGVLGQRLVAQDPQGEPVGDAAEAVVERGQRVVVGVRDEGEQCLVGKARQVTRRARGRRLHRQQGHETASLAASGLLVGWSTPPARSSVTATTAPRLRGWSILKTAEREKSPAGAALPLRITQAS